MTKTIFPAIRGDRDHNQLASLEQKLGTINYRKIDELIAYDGNPRKHSKNQLSKLTASIREFGFAMPVLVDCEDVIIAGHARVEAARTAGMHEVPVLVADQWSKAQVRAYRLADNRLAELSDWNEELLAVELAAIIEFDETSIEILGWETAEIDLIFDTGAKDDAADPADDCSELPKIPVSVLGDLWHLGQHRLFCGSSLDSGNWTTLMDGHEAAMVFTDAPYNVPVTGHITGLGRASHAEFAMASGEMSKSEFTAFLSDAIGHMSANLKDGGVLTLAMDWRHSGEMLAAIEASGLTLINMCVWNKNNGGMGSLYRSKHELFWIAKKGKAPHTNNVELGRFGRYRTNIWDYAGVNSFGKTRMEDLADHPTVKPTALVADAIRDVTHPGEVIIDAFMGSGTTILAAERTKRIAYGMDIEPKYIDVAVRRWEAMTGKRAMLAETGETIAELALRRTCSDAVAGSGGSIETHDPA